MTSLTHKTLNAGVWSALNKFGAQFVQFVVQIILARLLLPEQFGLIAMLSVFIQLGQILIISGFSLALVQKKEITNKDCNSVFYFNIVAGLVIYGLLYILSPWVSEFYKQPQLTIVLRILSLNLVIGSLGQVQNALLTKDLDFKSLFKAGFFSLLISGGIGIVMAWRGFGVWALVGQQVSLVFFRTIGFWILSSWTPSLVFCFESLKGLFTFGSKLLVTMLIDTFFNNLYPIIIGRLFSPMALGYYSNGQRIPMTLMQGANGAISSVLLPSFSRKQDDPVALNKAMRKAVKISFFVICPMMVGLMSVASPLVSFLLTDKWLACVPVLKWMCAYFMFWPVHVINMQMLAALGRTDLILRLEIIKKILIVAAIWISYRYGVVAMAAGQAVVSVIFVFINSWNVGSLINYSTWRQWGDILPILFSASIMGVVVWSIGLLEIKNPLILLALQISSGLIIYAGGSFVFRVSGIEECKSLFVALINNYSIKK